MARNLKTLWQDACVKVLSGEVALNEVLHLKPEAR
jgi:hypothetical protein